MPEVETFRTLAEIGIALAGFTGIVAVLGRRAHGEWTPLERARLRDLLLTSFGVVFFAFVPELLQLVISDVPTVWRVASGLFAVHHIAGLSLFLGASGAAREILRSPTATPRRLAAIAAPLGICIVLAQLAIAVGLAPSIAYFVYFLALLWMLLVGSVQFFLLLLSS